MALDVTGLHVGKRVPQPRIGPGVLDQHHALIVRCRHRYPLVDGREDRAVSLGVDPVRQAAELLMQLRPERDAIGSYLADRRLGPVGQWIIHHLSGAIGS